MKILILAAWFRNLAVTNALALREQGHEVRIVTTGAQKNRAAASAIDYETVLNERLKTRANLADTMQAYRECRKWRAEVCLLDVTWDPRFLLLASTARKTVAVIHDATPHDRDHVRTGWKRHLEERSQKKADSIACFSEFVKSEIQIKKRIFKLALPTEIDCDEPAVELRAGFAFVGRLSEYKGLDFLLESWSVAVGRLEPKDNLTILGSGNYDLGRPKGVKVLNREFTDLEAARLLASVKAVILPYSEASQSGVQVAAMRYGAPTIVTDRGALPEFQPHASGIVEYGNVNQLADAIIRYSDINSTLELSSLSRKKYQDCHSQSAVGLRLNEMISALCM